MADGSTTGGGRRAMSVLSRIPRPARRRLRTAAAIGAAVRLVELAGLAA